MLGRHTLVAHADRDGLCGLQESFGAVAEFLDIHSSYIPLDGQSWTERDMVLQFCNASARCKFFAPGVTPDP
ncbi:hypothetical protein SmB9_33900 [Sphingosinicella microcystinivorans]|uniref:Uncharacterized protein n=1 Tax=Sphingosinicella microcystinivorans TaxID=335406 RepID=A0AAD1D969_SPHMI|nr:hypothetical protein SmB9_33900 [Sphingosinicella microcystinivorans]